MKWIKKRWKEKREKKGKIQQIITATTSTKNTRTNGKTEKQKLLNWGNKMRRKTNWWKHIRKYWKSRHGSDGKVINLELCKWLNFEISDEKSMNRTEKIENWDINSGRWKRSRHYRKVNIILIDKKNKNY